jgi:hypothetical protein
VLTGNLREVARIKLEVFELLAYVDLDSSAYGCFPTSPTLPTPSEWYSTLQRWIEAEPNRTDRLSAARSPSEK